MVKTGAAALDPREAVRDTLASYGFLPPGRVILQVALRPRMRPKVPRPIEVEHGRAPASRGGRVRRANLAKRVRKPLVFRLTVTTTQSTLYYPLAPGEPAFHLDDLALAQYRYILAPTEQSSLFAEKEVPFACKSKVPP